MELVERAEEAVEENPVATSEEQEEQQQKQQRQKEQVQKILSNVRQNFGKIYVAPEFSEEDLVPVEMPDLDMSDFSGSEDEENDEEEEESAEEDEASAEPADAEAEESEPTTAQAGKASGSKSSREVIRELDEKISKYKQFLDRAKSKRFSAIRSVFSHPNLARIFSLFSPITLISLIQSWNLKLSVSEMPCILGGLSWPALKPPRGQQAIALIWSVACFITFPCHCSLMAISSLSNVSPQRRRTKSNSSCVLLWA